MPDFWYTRNISGCRVACPDSGGIHIQINYYDYVPYFPQFLGDYVPIGAELQTAFYGSNLAIFDELYRHSLLNLQTVLNHCLVLSPQIWVGAFSDALNPSYQMWSIAPPYVPNDAMIAKLREFHALESSTRVASSRSTPLVQR